MNKTEFLNLLLKYSQGPDQACRESIEKQLWSQFGREVSPCVIDMSGFSRLTQRYGVVHYLSMVRRMQLTVQPIIEKHNGSVLKFEADNTFAIFPEPLMAVKACIEANQAFEEANKDTPPEMDIRIACGIDHGDILIIEDRDFFGNAVNRASKLGEDVARPGEILLTGVAAKCLPTDHGLNTSEMPLSISGIEIIAVQVHY